MRRIAWSWWALGALVAASTLVRFWGAVQIDGLWIMPDEAIYALVGRNLWENGRLAILDGPPALYSLLYPALVGLPMSVGNLERGYLALKAVQALVMSLTAVPVYLWARTLTRPTWAFVAAALTVSVPALLYAGFVMTEVAFYPAVAFAAWRLARALAEPSRTNLLLLVAAFAIAFATRLQAVVLIPVLLTALVAYAVLERRRSTLVRFAPVLGAIALCAAGWAAWRLHADFSWPRLLGSYAAVAQLDYSVAGVARSIVDHVGTLVLATAIMPLPAVVLLARDVIAQRLRTRDMRAYVVTALALSFWIVLQVAVFASEAAEHPLERDMIGLAPVLFVGFAAWLGSGTRPRVFTSIVAVLALAPVVALPVRDLVAKTSLADSFTFAPFQEREPTQELALLLYVAAAAALAAFVLLPRRLLPLLPAAALVFLGANSVVATREVAERVTYDQQKLLGGARAWVDSALGNTTVAFVYGGERYWNGVWQHLVWNPQITRVYSIAGQRVPGGLPQQRVRPDADGTLRLDTGAAVPAQYAVASTWIDLFGTRVAEIRQFDLDVVGHVLWRVGSPLRVSSIKVNLRPDGDMYSPGRLVAYDCAHGELQLTLLAKASRFVALIRNGELYRRVDLEREARGKPDDRYWNGSVPPPPGAERCVFIVRGDSLLGSTRFEFVRG